ncbi:MAG: NAD(P)-binding domain-containing protein, partial [Propionicimonas sp.]
MKIAVLGTGPVGRTLAARLSGLGHEVAIGTRDASATMASTKPDAWGGPAFPTWLEAHPDLRLGSFADTAAAAELVVNATNGARSVEALTLAGA